MKYIVILGDGMADTPVPQLGNRTPLQVAHKPYMDKIASFGTLGLVKTVPDDLPPGSDVANLSVMGYDPHIFYTGRSPLEAVSMGVEVGAEDTTFRTNLVTLSEEADYAQKTMVDYSADEISTPEAHELIAAVQQQLGTPSLSFFGGIAYRHLLVWHGLEQQFALTPPHDISGKCVADYLPDSPILLDLMEKSHRILKDHPINVARVAKGLHPANSLWIWGQGKKPALTPFAQKFGVTGGVISAVDLVKGIGLCADMTVIEVPGATGNLHTNFAGKGQAALEALKTLDFVYVHIEAPDECGHRFEIENKVRAIELIDQHVLGPIFEQLTAQGEEFSILLLPDHPTPLALGTHTCDPVPYAIYRSTMRQVSELTYTEADAAEGPLVAEGAQLMALFLKGAHHA